MFCATGSSSWIYWYTWCWWRLCSPHVRVDGRINISHFLLSFFIRGGIHELLKPAHKIHPARVRPLHFPRLPATPKISARIPFQHSHISLPSCYELEIQSQRPSSSRFRRPRSILDSDWHSRFLPRSDGETAEDQGRAGASPRLPDRCAWSPPTFDRV